jgi:hypothetical protein
VNWTKFCLNLVPVLLSLNLSLDGVANAVVMYHSHSLIPEVHQCGWQWHLVFSFCHVHCGWVIIELACNSCWDGDALDVMEVQINGLI